MTPILLLLFGGVLAYGFRQRDALLGRFAANRLLEQLTEQASVTRTWIKAGCILLAVLAIGIALARPQLGVEWSERKARGLDIVFILDSSKSMLATDLRPTRLDRAKLAIIDLVERLESDRIGLIAFAGQAFLQTPPTLDYSAFYESLNAIDPNIMTSGGSDLGNAINEATDAFPSENNVKIVVLLTDGEDLSGNAATAAVTAREDGIQVFAIGIGTPEGEYLRIRNEQGVEEFVRDSSGQPVLSKLDEGTLQAIALATGGSYSRLSSDSLDQLYNSVIAKLPREERKSELQEIGIERFQWALASALVFLVFDILIRRRRSAAIHAILIALLVSVFHPNESQAQMALPMEGTGPPQADTPRMTDARISYNAAHQALIEGNFTDAMQGYETTLAQTDDLALQGKALYNLAHATYQQGRKTYEAGDPQSALNQVKKAEALFQSAQEIDTSDTSIQADIEQVSRVREAIEKLIEQQEPQDSEEQSGESEENQDSSNEGEDSEDSQDGEQSESGEQGEDSSKDQQNQENQSGEESSEQSQQNQEGSEGDQSEESGDPQNQESTDEGGESESAQSADQESTQDPVDDIPQPQPGEEGEESGDEEDQQAASPEATEGESNENDQAGSMSSEAIEGMTEAEAAALLDSLRGKESLLPFIDQGRGSNQRKVRDW
jgi:Ca-activated chloride channel family protein